VYPEREAGSQINSKILEVKLNRDRRLEELQNQRNELQSRADEQIANRLEPVMREGQTLERTLQESQGKAVRSKVVFSGSTETTVAESGESITAQHLSKVQRIVKERLDEIESEFKEELQRDLDQIDLTKSQARAEAEEQMEALRNQLEDQSAESQNQNSRLRDELHELRPFTFLSESRFRELKQRWGQVFRADMGAEAFYDILRRLDLDKLSEDLWVEVRTSKSKQKRKKATTRSRS
jgi:DNA-directed RNA polymerase subunit beta'